MKNGTYLYEQEPRNPFDIEGWKILEKEMVLEVASFPGREEAQNHLDYVRANISWLNERLTDIRKAT